MTEQTTDERELAKLVVEWLNLEELDAAGIDPQAPLFGDGLELDSIDSPEIALAVSRQYGCLLRCGDPYNARLFTRCVRWQPMSRDSAATEARPRRAAC